MTGNANGDVWTDRDGGYIRRGNAKSIFHGTGTEISTLDIFKQVTPTSFYNFESSNANDSVGSNNLTENGTPTYSSSGGIDGTYVILNGSSQYLTASSSSVFDVTTGDFTICGYIYRTSDSGGSECIVWKRNSLSNSAGYGIFINSSDQLQAEICDGSANRIQIILTTPTISTNTWYFWAVSYDRDGNGVLYLYNTSTGATATQTTAISSQPGSATTTQTFTVGRNSASSASFFPGRMDDIRFYNYALSASNIQALYSSRSQYAFAGNGNDSVGSNNLTANGTPTYGSDGGVYGQYVILNGSSQYFTAANNTVFDVTTGDFSLWGFIYRTSDSGGVEEITRKKTSNVSGNPGYSILINASDKLQVFFSDSTTQVSPSTTSSISTNTWYFWTVSFARSGNLTIYLYNMSSGAYETSSASISTITGSLTNTQTFTVGRSSASSAEFFPGRIDHLNILIGTAITAQNVQDIISKLHGGQIAQCHGTSGGFTSGLTYKRDMENTTWYQLVDTNNTQTITGDKTLSGTTTFNSAPVIANNIPIRWKDSGGTTRNVAYIDGSNDLFIQNDANGFAYVQTDNGSGAGNLVTRFTFGKGAAQGAAGITYYEPLSSGHADAGLVNPLFHTYGRRFYDLSDLDYLSNPYATGSNAKDTTEGGFTLTTGASSTNKQSVVYPNISANHIAFRRDRKWEAAFLVEVVTNDANTYFELGFTTDVTPDLPRTTTASISFKFDPGTDSHWIVRNANGTTQTSTTSSVTVSANTIYYLYMINNESSIKFYINGSLVATHTTNLPTATTTMAAEMIVRTGTTAAKSLKILNGTRVWVDDQT